jgi:hypothetical protein
MRFCRYSLAVGLITLLLLHSVPSVTACGPAFATPIFVFKESPDRPFEQITGGKLGIVRPSLGRKTLAIVYRYLNGGSFTTDEQSALIDALNGKAPEEEGNDALKAWISARKELLGEEQQLPAIYTERQYAGYDFFPNCTKNAFEVATQTLKDRVATYGAQDPNVKVWIAAQDVVFQNCSGGKQVPNELSNESPGWLRKDRDYQIAAAHFYSLNFEEARTRFEKIAADVDSPWQEISGYLVARTLVRQASLTEGETKKRELYERAENELQRLMLAGGKFASAAEKLLGVVKYNLHPDERVLELGRSLAAGSDEGLRQDLIDYVWLLDKIEWRIVEGNKQPEPPSKPNERWQRINAGELINIALYPKKPEGTPDYSKGVQLDFNYDASEAQIVQAFVDAMGRPLTPEEITELKQSRDTALSLRRRNVSPNRKWQSGGLSKHEGCYGYGCTKLTFDQIPDFLRSNDLSDWILTFQTEGPSSYGYAFSKWHDARSPAWLITTLTKADKSSAKLDEAIRAAEKIERGDPAYPTIAYHLIRLKVAQGNVTEARKLLDEIMSSQAETLPVSARNLFLEQRMSLAKDLNEFLKSAQRKPLGFILDGELGTINELMENAKSSWTNAEDFGQTKLEHDQEVDSIYKDLLPWDGRLTFDGKTTDIFNWHLSVQTLAEAARNPNLPDYLQRNLALAAWTRAVLLNRDDVAASIAPQVLQVAPEMSDVLTAYLRARTAKQKRNAALYVMLKFPDLSPFIPADVPEFTTSEQIEYYFESAWWCELPETDLDEAGNEIAKVVPVPSFLTAEQVRTAQREHQALRALSDGKSYLGKRVIEWATTSPADPRIPEALFTAVKANESYKYGCNGWDNDEATRKTAEKMLRRRYPHSPWTAKLNERDDQ